MSVRSRRRTPRVQAGTARPGVVIAGAFAAAVAVGTALLSVPAATETGTRAPFLDALFTATSAVCVTGLVTVDTGTYWSGLGEGIILALIQAGGLGIMTLATIVALLLSRRLGLRTQLVVQSEARSLTASDVRRVVRKVVLFSLAFEAALALLLAVRLRLAHGEGLRESAYSGVFHAVSAFNNAGFGLHPDSLVRYVSDPWISYGVATAVIVGGLGFPVVFELARSWRRPRTWSVLTQITLVVTGALLVLGTLAMLLAEWRNPATLGALPSGDRFTAAFFAAVMPRTAGFNSLDLAALNSETLLITDLLMFIGGGSAGTAGGIKVTTFGLLAYVLWAELRGDVDVEVGRRRVPTTNQRQALAVALLALGTIATSTLLMLAMTDLSLDVLLFETVSAFSTVGMTVGITAGLPEPAQYLLVLLMFVGRVGPLTLASGLALRERARRHQLPEERTLVG